MAWFRGGFRPGQRFGRGFREAGGNGGDDLPEGLLLIGTDRVKLGADYVVLNDG